MLTLRLLGGLALTAAGKKPGPAASQRRPLALLAIIAAGGGRGVSREQALLYLWPESTTSSARSTLNQTLYALRRDLKEPNLFGAGPTLRLNPDVVRCDVWGFEQALARRDLIGAAELYGGPFLYQFEMRSAPEFDRWVEAERSRLAQRFYQLAVTLAERSAQQGDHARAVEYWQMLVAQDRLSALAAGGLISALAAAGDRPAALKAAREYAELVRAELGMPVEPRISNLIESLEQTTVPSVPLVTGVQVATLLDESTGEERFARRPGSRAGSRTRSGIAARQAPAKKTKSVRAGREHFLHSEIVETAVDVIYTADLNGSFTYTNPAGSKLLGLPREDILGRVFMEFVREDFRYILADFYSRQVQTRTPVTYFEFPVHPPSGVTVWLGQYVHLLPAHGPPRGIVAVARDITLSKQVQRGQSYLSVRDRATGLLNAAAFRVLVDHRIALAQRLKKGFLLVFVNIENEEAVMAAGEVHAADDMLVLVAKAVRASFRSSDAIARIAVDRLAVLAVDANEADTEVLEKRFLEHLTRLHNPVRDTPWPLVRVTAAFYDPALPPSMDLLFGPARPPRPG